MRIQIPLTLFHADPEPMFHIDANQNFLSMRIGIWILLLMKVMLISDCWCTDPPGLRFEPLLPHFERSRPSMAPFRAFTALEF